MPWKSKAQAAWGHSEAGEEALGGEAAVKEWDNASRGKKLPKHAKQPIREKHDAYDPAPHISKVTRKD